MSEPIFYATRARQAVHLYNRADFDGLAAALNEASARRAWSPEPLSGLLDGMLSIVAAGQRLGVTLSGPHAHLVVERGRFLEDLYYAQAMADQAAREQAQAEQAASARAAREQARKDAEAEAMDRYPRFEEASESYQAALDLVNDVTNRLQGERFSRETAKWEVRALASAKELPPTNSAPGGHPCGEYGALLQSLFDAVRGIHAALPEGHTMNLVETKSGAAHAPQRVEIVSMPTRETTTVVERDDHNNLVASRQVESDALTQPEAL